MRLFSTAVVLFSLVAAAEEPAATTAAQAFAQIKEGNGRFVDGKSLHDDATPKARIALAHTQHPHTSILTCADSRVSPELLFDQGLGHLFTVRIAGNTAGNNSEGSLEYGVEHLGTHLLVVMGHVECGALNTTLNTPPGKSAGSNHLDKLVAEIRENIAPTVLTAEDLKDKTMAKAARANVDGVVRRLLATSPLLKKKVDAGELVIVPALYTLETGKVEFWGPAVQQLEKAARAPDKK